MKMRRFFTMAVAVSFVGVVGVQAEQGMKQGQERFDKQIGTEEGGAMGVPVPGSASDTESTKKMPDVSNIKSSQSLDRLPYRVEGEILKIDGQNYEIRPTDSAQTSVKLMVNKDTNLDCAAAPTSGKQGGEQMTTDRMSAKEQAPKASEQQLAQGQQHNETARGSGFKIGDCNFKKGDRVRAEIDDNNRVTTLKYLTSGDSSSQR
ncbi:MAG TPA: hypothetical protein VJ692_12885 [Nitrospiraceae bacterium]|nr:hypothetical protein [Nitrospiraceae bacterium]